MSNRHEWPEVLFGLAAMGAICVPVNVLLRGPEVRHVIDDSAVSVLIVDKAAERALSELDELPKKLITVGEVNVPPDCTTVPLAEAVSRVDDFGPTRPRHPEATFIHYYTSGTTGLPKAAVHSHSGVLWNPFTQIPDLGLTRDDRYLCVPSLSWVAGFHNLVLALIWTGGFSAIMPTGETSIDHVVAAIEDERITHTFLVNTDPAEAARH